MITTILSIITYGLLITALSLLIYREITEIKLYKAMQKEFEKLDDKVVEL